MMDGIKEIADGFDAELKRRLPNQRKTQRTKLALLVATMLDERSANLMELAAGLPREADRTGPLDPMGRAQAGTIRLTASIADQTLWRSCHGKTDRCCADRRCRRGRPDFSGAGTEPLELACRQPHACRRQDQPAQACRRGYLLALIERLRTRVEQKTGQPVQVISCYEAGYDGFWLDRKLKAEGVVNHVMDPASIQVDRRARRVKPLMPTRCCAP
jgi:hypothetical protein